MARPAVWLLLSNRHDPKAQQLIHYAIVDTGADSSVAPEYLGALINHNFKAGEAVPGGVVGLGGTSLECRVHSTEVSVLKTLPNGLADPTQIAIPSVLLDLTFVQDVPGVEPLGLILLGQRDFLEKYNYYQSRSENYFELTPVKQ